MKLKRRQFTYFVYGEERVLGVFFNEEISSFIERLGDKFVSISEYLSARSKTKDEGIMNFVVFYWSTD